MTQKALKGMFKSDYRGFHGGSVVKNPPTNAGDSEFDPSSRKISHALEQLRASPSAATIEPVL